MKKLPWYHAIRYEYQQWPLWRLDLDLAYILKSFKHQNYPKTNLDAHHYLEMNKWLEQHQGITEQTEQSTVLSAVGDMMWIRSGWSNALSPKVKQILGQADVTVANLETPIDPARKVPKWVYETFHYNASVDYLSGWKDLPSQAEHIFSLCNNHALDQQESGLAATRSAVLGQGANFHCLGGTNPDDELSVITVKGMKIGFMASTFAINHLKKEQTPPAGIPLHLFGAAHCEPDWFEITQKINKLRKEGAEFIIYSSHWGYEYEYWPDALQRKHALKLIELGVDLILGHSPHVIQPVELVSINQVDETCPLQVARPGSKKFAGIAWSLGNFLTIMPTLECKTGVILQLELVRKAHDVLIKNIQLTPVYTAKPEGGHWLDKQVMCLNELPTKYHFLKPKIMHHCQKISPLIVTGDKMISKNNFIKHLDSYCQEMAQSIIPLLSQIDLNQYQNFLEMMYHYTLDSGKRLSHAAEQAQDKEIKKVFAELAREEQYHYRLAAADLKTFGRSPRNDTPESVTDFDAFWLHISPAEEYQYVGALYVLENVARFLKDSIMPHFARLNIGPEQAKFILTHLVADDEHGDQLKVLCEAASSKVEMYIEMGAKKASNFWIAIHKDALEQVVY